MIDYVKLRIISETLAKWLLHESPFKDDFYTEVYGNTGEIKEVNKRGQKCGIKYILNYRELTVVIAALKYVEITGSLHKYWTAKLIPEKGKEIWQGENYSDFSFQDLIACIANLSQTFNFKPLQARLHVVEFAVNISPVFNPFEFCGSLIASGNKPFAEMERKANQPEIGFICKKQRYWLKIYDKGKQYKTETPILRFEVKAKKMLFLSATGIKYLSDLEDKSKMEKLEAVLMERFDDLLINDCIDTSELSIIEKEIYNTCSNPQVWKKLKAWKRARLKPKFRLIIEKYGKHKWIDPTRRMIAEKWRMLLALNSPTANNLTSPAQTRPANKLTGGQVKGENVPLQQINLLGKEIENSTPQTPIKRQCAICSSDISPKKSNCLYCSKKCRNAVSNPRNNGLRSDKRRYGNGDNLFNPDDLKN